MVYIYSYVNFSLSCTTELFGRICLTSVETESLQEVCDQVYMGENHNFFIMVLIRIFFGIFSMVLHFDLDGAEQHSYSSKRYLAKI